MSYIDAISRLEDQVAQLQDARIEEARLRSELEKWRRVAMEDGARVKRLEKGIQDYLDGNFGPDFQTKHDRCPHEKFVWEDCGNCIDAHFTALLSPSHSETP